MNVRRDSVRPGWRRFSLLVAGLLAFGALAGQVALAGQATGNNGTVKIHEGPGEPPPEYPNQPHVCTFHLHFFADPEQAGTWEIQDWSPGDKGNVVLSGTYEPTVPARTASPSRASTTCRTATTSCSGR